MLYVIGKCTSCRSEEINSNNKKFTVHHCKIYDENSIGDIIKVNTGSMPLERGRFYQIPVWPRTYSTKDGRAGVELRTFKDLPPKELPPQPIGK